MSETKTECRTYKVEYVCDVCAKGMMEASGSVVCTNPPKYQHICTSCGHEGYLLETRYPEIRYEPIEALQINSLGCFEEARERAIKNAILQS